MICMFFESGNAIEFDCSLQEMKEALKQQLNKYHRKNPFVIINGVLINIEKITHIEEVDEV